jgi:hypothetical protein
MAAHYAREHHVRIELRSENHSNGSWMAEPNFMQELNPGERPFLQIHEKQIKFNLVQYAEGIGRRIAEVHFPTKWQVSKSRIKLVILRGIIADHQNSIQLVHFVL